MTIVLLMVLQTYSQHSNEPAHSVGEGGEPCDPGEAGEASTEVKSKEKGESATSIQPTQGGFVDYIFANTDSNFLLSVNESGTSAVAEQPSPATPLGSARPNIPDVDSSYSSAVIQELLQQAFSASQSQGAGQTWARSTNSNSYQVDSVDSGANLLFPQGQSHTSAAGPGAPTAGELLQYMPSGNYTQRTLRLMILFVHTHDCCFFPDSCIQVPGTQ